MSKLASRMLDAFQAFGEVLTIDQIAKRADYGISTVTCAMPRLAREGLVYRVAHGKYSMSPNPEIVFADQDALLPICRQHSFFTTHWARKAIGWDPERFHKALNGLIKRGLVRKIRYGTYTSG